jgi:hypothetical protein
MFTISISSTPLQHLQAKNVDYPRGVSRDATY